MAEDADVLRVTGAAQSTRLLVIELEKLPRGAALAFRAHEGALLGVPSSTATARSASSIPPS